MKRYSYTQLGIGECGHIIILSMGVKMLGERESETRYICDECSGSQCTQAERWEGKAVWVKERRGSGIDKPGVMRAEKKRKKKVKPDPYRKRRQDGLW